MSRRTDTVRIALILMSACLLMSGCGNSQRTSVTMEYLLGSVNIQEKPVRITSSRLTEADWPDGRFRTLEVSWEIQPDVIFHEVWIGFDSDNVAERQLTGYVVPVNVQGGRNNYLELNYLSTGELFIKISLQGVPTADQRRIRHVTLVNRIDDWTVDEDNSYQLNERAWRLATHPIDGARDGQTAVRYATRACELTRWNDPNCVDTLAAAFAETGDFVKAIETQKRAIALLPEMVGDESTRYREQMRALQAGHKIRTPIAAF